MTTNYDDGHTADQYQQAKTQPWHSRIATYSLMKHLGSVKGKAVVDAACGEGYYTRKIRQAGAVRVVGFDISSRMIELARAQETSEPLGIEYRVADASVPVPRENFDVLSAAWLLVYAHNRSELDTMCQSLARWLRPGGRFVSLTTNPEVYSFHPRPDYRKYGFEIKQAERAYEGAPILFTNYVGNESFEIENYYLPISAYEESLRKAGFSDFVVHPIELSPDPQGKDDAGYWADLLRNPVAIVIECVKT